MPTIPSNRLLNKELSGGPEGATPQITARFKTPDYETRGRILAKGIRDLGKGLASGLGKMAQDGEASDEKSQADAWHEFQSDKMITDAKFDQEQDEFRAQLKNGDISPEEYADKSRERLDGHYNTLAKRHESLQGKHRYRADAHLQQGRARRYGSFVSEQESAIDDRNVAEIDRKIETLTNRVSKDPYKLDETIDEARELIGSSRLSESRKRTIEKQALRSITVESIRTRLKATESIEDPAEREREVGKILQEVDRLPTTEQPSLDDKVPKLDDKGKGDKLQKSGHVQQDGSPVIRPWPKTVQHKGRTIGVPQINPRDFRTRPALPTHIVIHNTAGASNAAGSASWLNQTGRGYHYYIDQDGQVFQALPDNRISKHVNPKYDLGSGATSGNSIGISMVTTRRGRPNELQQEVAYRLASNKARELGINPSAILGHGDSFTNRQRHEGAEVSSRIRTEGLWDPSKSAAGSAASISEQAGAKVSPGPDNPSQNTQSRLAELEAERDSVRTQISQARAGGTDTRALETHVNSLEQDILKLRGMADKNGNPIPAGDADVRRIVQAEARRDKQGRIAVYSLPKGDQGGSYEVAGINDKYHPKAAAKARALIEAGKHEEAEAFVQSHIKKVTEKSGSLSEVPAISYLMRDISFHRGDGGAANIARRALGLKESGTKHLSAEEREIFAKAARSNPEALAKSLTAARQDYEIATYGNRPNLAKGLKNRFDKSLANSIDMVKTAPAPGPSVAPSQVRPARVEEAEPTPLDEMVGQLTKNGISNAQALTELEKFAERLRSGRGPNGDDDKKLLGSARSELLDATQAEIRRITKLTENDPRLLQGKYENLKAGPGKDADPLRGSQAPPRYRHLTLDDRRKISESVKHQFAGYARRRIKDTIAQLNRGAKETLSKDGSSIIDLSKRYLGEQEYEKLRTQYDEAKHYGSWSRDLNDMTPSEQAAYIKKLQPITSEDDRESGSKAPLLSETPASYLRALARVGAMQKRIEMLRLRDPVKAMEEGVTYSDRGGLDVRTSPVKEMTRWKKEELEPELRKLERLVKAGVHSIKGRDGEAITHRYWGMLLDKRKEIMRDTFGIKNGLIISLREARDLGDYTVVKRMTPDEYRSEIIKVTNAAHKKYGPRYAAEVVQNWVALANPNKAVREEFGSGQIDLQDLPGNPIDIGMPGTAGYKPGSALAPNASYGRELALRGLEQQIVKDQNLLAFLTGQPGDGLFDPSNPFAVAPNGKSPQKGEPKSGGESGSWFGNWFK